MPCETPTESTAALVSSTADVNREEAAKVSHDDEQVGHSDDDTAHCHVHVCLSVGKRATIVGSDRHIESCYATCQHADVKTNTRDNN